MWPDHSVNDYLYRPNSMEDMCFYEFIASCDCIHMSFNKMNNTDHTGMPILQDGEFAFQFDHPGRRYCYLKKSQKLKIPKISMPKGMICDLEELELDQLEPSDNAQKKRENYAKVALILFYPYRDKEIFQLDDHSSLWEKFIFLLKESDDSARFWKKGKDILQNMQDNIQCRKCKAPTDKLKEKTVSRNDVGDCCRRNFNDSDSEYSEYDDATSISLYDENEFLDKDDEDERNMKRNLSDLKKGEILSGSCVINSRCDECGSIFVSQNNDQNSSGEGNSEMVSQNIYNRDSHLNEVSSKYRTLLAFISGATIHSGFEESQFQNLTDQEFRYVSESNATRVQ